ncbi:hypothetical protein T8K17_00115 [Thalassobaculum sp. OXR-137]|uniref:hypothetical protein n=1 Tax=Thalassobaculum sp. OXR-137 TaxID=3100173 RepID=UPI002AC9374C|nr:hypothetical protein [Thalassobaculum sp. OXR-137]WPZ34551.1 hypothetical protein T8K17_00115 [Thalassobaculum sp. OXR-137]
MLRRSFLLGVSSLAPAARLPFHWTLSEAEVAAILTYVRNAFGNSASAVTEEAVADLRGVH